MVINILIMLLLRNKIIKLAVCKTLKEDFLSSHKPLAASYRVLARSQSNFQSSRGYDNLLNKDQTYLSNRHWKIVFSPQYGELM